MKRRWVSVIAMLLFAFLLTGCEASQSFYAMDTAMNISAYGLHAQDAVNESISYINELEAAISRTRAESDIAKLNDAQGEPVELSEQAADILSEALRLAQQTDGYFDPTIAPLSDLWGIGTEHAAVPAQTDIDKILPYIGYKTVQLKGNTALLAANIGIDLGGIGKGYAADQVAAILKQKGIKQALVSLGGNVYVIGEKEKGTPWSVGITDPDDESTYFGILSVSDTSVVTSGDYERYFEQNGKRYCHIFDPKTGYPAETDLRSVTVVSQKSVEADAYTTALFVMGFEKAKAFCQTHHIDAVFMRKDHTVYVTDGLKDKFSLESTEYTYET